MQSLLACLLSGSFIVVCLLGGKCGALPLFQGLLAKIEVHKPPGIVNILAAMAACYVYECMFSDLFGSSDVLSLFSDCFRLVFSVCMCFRTL